MEYRGFYLATFWKESPSVLVPEGPAQQSENLVPAGWTQQCRGLDLSLLQAIGSQQEMMKCTGRIQLGAGGQTYQQGRKEAGTEADLQSQAVGAGIWQKNVSVLLKAYISFKVDLFESRIFIDFVCFFSLSDRFNRNLTFSAHLVLELPEGNVQAVWY